MTTKSGVTWRDLYELVASLGSPLVREFENGYMELSVNPDACNCAPACWRGRGDLLGMDLSLVGVTPYDYTGESLVLPAWYHIGLSCGNRFRVPCRFNEDGKPEMVLDLVFVAVRELLPLRSLDGSLHLVGEEMGHA